MLRKFLRRHIGWALIFSAYMTLLIVFKPWNPRPLPGPWWSDLLRALMVFFGLLLTKLGIRALTDPQVNAKLRESLEKTKERLEKSLNQRKSRRETLEQR